MPDPELLGALLRDGVRLKPDRADATKWEAMHKLLRNAGDEKVVLFCQPVETVEVVVAEIERVFSERAAIIVGGQSDSERDAEIAAFRARDGRRFLVSSRAGGEGINLQVARRLIHLDVPWNPMDLEQRVGRIHRFGSREQILVDTIVVAGTREADAYRIAREKLRLIVSNLGPDAFEALFGRVMSLVPPEELAGAMASSTPWPDGGEVDTRLAQIVGAGYARWSEFTDRFAFSQERIAAIDPGRAEWRDLRSFLEQACGAEPAAAATRPVFTSNNSSVEVAETAVKTLAVFNSLYVCDETDGLPALDAGGRLLQRLGTAHRLVVSAMRARLTGPAEDQLGSIRLARSTLPGWPDLGPSIVLAYVSQRIEMVGIGGEERELRLELFVLQPDAEPSPVPRATVGELVREICSAERQATPNPLLLTAALAATDFRLVEAIRKSAPREDAISAIAVWPITCFAVTVV